MTLDLDHLSKLAEAATPGKWFIEPSTDKDFGCIGGICVRTNGRTITLIETDDGFYPPRRPDAELIVTMRNNIQELIRLARLGMKVEPG